MFEWFEPAINIYKPLSLIPTPTSFFYLSLCNLVAKRKLFLGRKNIGGGGGGAPQFPPLLPPPPPSYAHGDILILLEKQMKHINIMQHTDTKLVSFYFSSKIISKKSVDLNNYYIILYYIILYYITFM
jgi:hypothetical protein